MAINYLDLPIGRKYPYEVDCVVEIGKDTNLKYEYDERLHVFRLDRCLLSSMSYPCTYGFIPSTKAEGQFPYNESMECRWRGITSYPIRAADTEGWF